MAGSYSMLAGLCCEVSLPNIMDGGLKENVPVASCTCCCWWNCLWRFGKYGLNGGSMSLEAGLVFRFLSLLFCGSRYELSGASSCHHICLLSLWLCSSIMDPYPAGIASQNTFPSLSCPGQGVLSQQQKIVANTGALHVAAGKVLCL